MQKVCSYGDHYIAYEDLKMSIEAKIVAGAGREFIENLGTSAVILGYLFGMFLLFLWARIWLKEKRDISGVSRV